MEPGRDAQGPAEILVEHVELPLRLPDLSYLTNDELAALRQRLNTVRREARARATATMAGLPTVQKAWIKSLSLKTDDHERGEIMRALEAELLRHPEAYLEYAHANSLIALDEAIKAEMIQRDLMSPKKRGRKAAEPTPPTAPALPTETPDVMTMMEMLED